MTKAIFNGQVIADSDEIVMIEGNKYFPPNSVNMEFFSNNDTKTVCPWKGEASYYDIEVEGQKSEAGAWYYPNPKSGSEKIVKQDFTSYVAFWPNRGVEISD